MVAPKITVIIPTRERCDVLVSALRTVTSQDYDNLHIIVSDNCSRDDTQHVVRCANDPRVRYLNTGERLSMSHNWEFALSHVSDGWVTFIGDDDGLLPGAVETIAEIIASSDVEAIRSAFCTYRWPAVMGNEHGQLIVPMRSGMEMRSAPHWLGKVMRGLVKYPQLPLIYDGGFIKFEALNKIKNKTKHFFGSCNPDLYSAIAVASVIDRFLYLHAPMAMLGVSRHSIGNSAFYGGKNKVGSAPIDAFYLESNIPFHNDVPCHDDGSLPISHHALVYEAYLQSGPLRQAAGPDKKQQLEIILATAGAHRASIDKWAQKFASQHAIDFPSAKRFSAIRRAYLQPLSLSRKVLNAANTIFAENLPIRNIHEACVAAGVIRSRPGKSGTLRFLTRELIGRTKVESLNHKNKVQP